VACQLTAQRTNEPPRGFVRTFRVGKDVTTPVRYDQDTKAKAIRLVREHGADYQSEWAAISAVAGRLGMSAETLHKWIRQAEGVGGDGYTFLTCSVYDTCMSRVRTNIEIEDTYLQAVMDRYGLHTKTEAVEMALRHLAGQPMSREEALAMRGAHAFEDLPADAPPRVLG
jgi:Arc/MetJ family transcription regulator